MLSVLLCCVSLCSVATAAGGVKISPAAEVMRQELDEPLTADGKDPEAADPMEPIGPVLRAIPGLFAAGKCPRFLFAVCVCSASTSLLVVHPAHVRCCCCRYATVLLTPCFLCLHCAGFVYP